MRNKKTKNNPSALKWVFRRSKKFLPSVIITSVQAALISLSGIALALISKNVLDTATGVIEGSLLICGIQLLGIVIFQITMSGTETLLKTYVTGKLTIHFRNHIFGVISSRKYSQISAYHSGDLLNRITSDGDVIVSSIVNTIPHIAAILAQIIGGIYALFVLDKRIAIIVLVLGLTVPAIGRLCNRKFKQLHKEIQATEGKTRSFIQECFENIVIIKTFISEAPFMKKLNHFMEKNYKVRLKRSVISMFTRLSLYSFFTLGYYVILLWGADNISKGAITYGTLMAFLQLVSQLRAPLQNVSGIIPQYFAAIASAERLMELEDGDFDTKGYDREKLSEVENNFQFINADNVTFAYQDELILKDCSFSAKKGEITAITGESGSGKSTIFKLILNLYEPQQGSIKINDSIPLNTSLRGLFAYVPQGNMVLSGTIRENISLCDDGISDEEIMKAARVAEIDELIASMPLGLETQLSERGSGLSEGQIQRISIARAILTNAPILLLDEATSALDEATESKVLKNIKGLTNKTVLFVTHRHTSLSVCDSIIHVSNGSFNKIK